MTSAVKIRAGLIDIDIDIEHMPVPDLAGSLLRGSSSTAAGCGLMFFVIFALSGGYGSGYERSYSGLFMDLLCSDFLCLCFFGMDVFTFLVGILGVFHWRVVWRFPLSSHHLVATELAAIGVFLGCSWTCFALISCVAGFSVWMSPLFWLRSWASFIGGSFGVFHYLRII